MRAIDDCSVPRSVAVRWPSESDGPESREAGRTAFALTGRFLLVTVGIKSSLIIGRTASVYGGGSVHSSLPKVEKATNDSVGPMQQFLQIRDKLLEAVDQDYNVVDMDGVLRVLSQLETFHITKEALEATRLGKHINEVRRKASDKYLASRAKNLVKKWRQLLVSSSHTASPAASPAMAPSATAISARLQGRHPALENCVSMPSSANTSPVMKDKDNGAGLRVGSSVNVPSSVSLPVSPYEDSRLVSKTHAANKRLRKEGLSRNIGSNTNSNHAESCSDTSSLSPTLINGAASRSPVNNNNIGDDNNGSRSTPGLSNVGPTSFSGVLEPRSSRGRRQPPVPDVLGQQMEVVRRASSNKVRTTREIVQDLVKKSTSPGLMANSVARAAAVASSRSNSSSPALVSKVVSPQGDKDSNDRVSWKSGSDDEDIDEEDEENEDEDDTHETRPNDNGDVSSDSDVPDSRTGRKRKRPSSKRPSSQTSMTTTSTTASETNPCDEMVQSVMQRLPALDRETVLREMAESVSSSSEDEGDVEGLVPVKRPEVEEWMVDAVLNTDMEQCNGNVDADGHFRDWSQVLSRPTANDETLFALPYCIID